MNATVRDLDANRIRDPARRGRLYEPAFPATLSMK